MNHELPRWLESMLGVGSTDSGEGTVWSLDDSWSWAPWATLLLVLLITALVTFCYQREIGSAGRWMRALLICLRLSLVGIVLFMLAEFVLSLKRTGLPILVVAVDDSQSMARADRYHDSSLQKLVAEHLRTLGAADATRLNLTKALLVEGDTALLEELGRRYQLKLYLLSDTARERAGTPQELADKLKELSPDGTASRLGDGIRQILNDLRGTRPSAIVLFSDGINTEGESLTDAAAYARRKGVPLFTVGMGDDQPVRDVELADLLMDEVVFVDDVVNVEAKLTSSGFAGRKVELVLRQAGKQDPVARTTIEIQKNADTQRVRIPFTPREEGDFEYTLEASKFPEEEAANNNSQLRAVSVRNETLKVLMVQSYPNYEFRYLKHLLERSTSQANASKKTFELSTVLQAADVEYATQDQSARRVFPVRREELFEYDCLIFGDVDPAFLGPSALQNISDFVTEKGAGLVVVAGPLHTPLAYRGTPLAALLPVELDSALVPPADQPLLDGFRVEPTDLGFAAPAMQLGSSIEDTALIWKNLPELYWMLEAPESKPAARVLATHPTKHGAGGQKLPLMTMQYVGAGEVLLHCTDETWRWRFRVGDAYFSRYWVQTIRYLSRSKLLGKNRAAALTVDRRQYQRGDVVRLRARFMDDRQAPTSDDGVTIMLEKKGEQSRRVQLHRREGNRGVFEGTIDQPVEGSYHAWIIAPNLAGKPAAVDFSVVAPPGESQSLEMDTAELKGLARLTDGRFYTLVTVADLLNDLPPGRQVPVESLPPLPLWNQWPLLLLFLVLLVTEWVLRKRKGML